MTMLELLDEQEAAAKLRLSGGTLRQWRYKREGPPFVKLGRRIMYRPEDVARWLAGRVQQAPADDPPQRPRRGSGRPA